MNINLNIKSDVTPYLDINDVLLIISNGIFKALDKNLVGLYLFGSLTYGDFNPDSSDIDLAVIVSTPLPVYPAKCLTISPHQKNLVHTIMVESSMMERIMEMSG